MKSNSLSILILIPFAATFLSACGGAAGSQASATPLPPVSDSSGIVAEGRLEPIRYAQIGLNIGGLVSEVLVEEGQDVSAGELIARLENTQSRTLEDAQASALQELTSAYQEVRDAQFKLDDFDIPSGYADMTPEEAVVDTLIKLDAAREAFEPYRDLGEKRLEYTKQERQKDFVVFEGTAKIYKKRLDDAWADHRKAIQRLELESTLEAAQARLAEAQKDNDALQDASFAEDSAGVRAALAGAEVRAPFAGTITNLELKLGELAESGQPIVTIADLSRWVVKTTDLTEIDVVGISEGQAVTLTLDALPDVELSGVVQSIGQGYSEKQGDIVYEVTVLLTDQVPGMRWGMTAEIGFGQDD